MPGPAKTTAVDAKRSVICPNCGKRLSASASYAGRKLKCPQCQKQFACEFDAAERSSAGTGSQHHGGFRMIEVADAQPKRSGRVELFRLGLGLVGAVVGGVFGTVLWGISGALLGYVVGFIAIPFVGGITGLGMRLGYGRFGDGAASGIAGFLAMGFCFLGFAALIDGSHAVRGLAVSIALSGALAFCVSYGYGFDGNDID